jgi:CRP/FNR family transcriptional regulator, cyclic AMP receptor protein
MATRTRLRKLPPSGLKPKRKSAFDPQVFLESVGASRTVSEFQDKEVIFSQGDAATSVLYIQKGSVKLTVVNESGKEAIVAIFGSTDFFGEGCMAGQPLSGFPALVNTTEYTTSFPASCAVMSAPSFGSS